MLRALRTAQVTPLPTLLALAQRMRPSIFRARRAARRSCRRPRPARAAPARDSPRRCSSPPSSRRAAGERIAHRGARQREPADRRAAELDVLDVHALRDVEADHVVEQGAASVMRRQPTARPAAAPAPAAAARAVRRARPARRGVHGRSPASKPRSAAPALDRRCCSAGRPLLFGRQAQRALEVVARVPVARVDAQQVAIALLGQLDQRQRRRRCLGLRSVPCRRCMLAEVVQRLPCRGRRARRSGSGPLSALSAAS